MTKIKLYIAASMDGFIAREDGSLDWLPGSDPEAGPILDAEGNPVDGGYTDFIAQIDTIVMGRATYETVLSFGEWPYDGLQCIVVSTNSALPVSTPDTRVLHTLSEATIQEMKAASQKHIWLVGGGEIIKRFLELKAIDEMILTTIPVLLGQGIPLFQTPFPEQAFEQVDVENYNGHFVNVTYKRKP